MLLNSQCVCSATIWLSGRSRNPYFVVPPPLLTLFVLCLLLLLFLLLTPVLVCGCVASGMQCFITIPKMLMVNYKMIKNLASRCKGN